MILKLVSDRLSIPVVFNTYHYRMDTIMSVAKEYEARVFVLDDTGGISEELK